MSTSFHMTVNDDGEGQLDIIENGEVFSVLSSNPNFPLYVDAALEGKTLSEIRSALPDITPLTELSERVEVNENTILFDGEEVHDTLAKTIQRYWLEGRPYSGLVKFMERLSLNTCEHSRNALWDWVKDRDLEINNQGLLITYKGVNSDLTSKTAGWAFVDDVRVDGHIPNQVGSVVSMPRSEVEHNPSKGCSTGLHVGTKTYAQNFANGGALLVCLVDPVDIVSVPTDCNWEKMRTCRYEVIDMFDMKREYEPVATDEIGYESVADRITRNTPTPAQSFVKNMLNKIRGNRS